MSARPRVLWITNLFHHEGDAGIRGIFVTQLWRSLLATGEVGLEREIVAQDRGILDYALANGRVRERWRGGRFDLAHVHYGLTGLATLRLPASAPTVFSFYGSDINSSFQRRVAMATAGRARRRIFVSRRLADLWPTPENRVVPNGVDFAACAPSERGEACRSLDLDPERCHVLFGADPANPGKGYEAFQEVMARVRRARPDAEEIVLSKKWQPYERVVAKLNAADVLLFTSRRGTEGSPTVVKEALAVNLPVVSVEVGDVPEMLAGVEPGRVVPWPAGSERTRESWLDDLTDGVVSVLASRRRSNGRTKRSFLRQEEIARRVIEIYREVIER